MGCDLPNKRFIKLKAGFEDSTKKRITKRPSFDGLFLLTNSVHLNTLKSYGF